MLNWTLRAGQALTFETSEGTVVIIFERETQDRKAQLRLHSPASRRFKIISCLQAKRIADEQTAGRTG
jgi:hypothetical protein